MVDSLIDYLSEPHHQELLSRLLALEVSTDEPLEESANEGALVGQTFCVTGVLSRKREDVHQDIRKAGGTVHDKVKKGTDFLVCGEKVGQSKIAQAKKYGTEVISEKDLLLLISGDILPTQEVQA
jgi:DNA ligase (NAD+)